jgi:hypothetical protein
MARQDTWVNADGLRVGFGARDSFNEFDANVHTVGRIKQMEVIFNADNVGTLADAVAPLSKDFQIPAGSVVVRSTARVLQAVTGATDFIIGLKDYDDGASNDPNGLHTAFAAVTAGTVDPGDGALINVELDEDQALSVTPTGTMTGGEVVVLVEYIEPVPSQDAPGILTGEV